MIALEHIWLYLLLAITSCCTLFLTFMQARSHRRLGELEQKHHQLQAEKQQVEQWAIQQQTKAEAIAERLTDKTQSLMQLQQKVDLAEQQEDQLEHYIHELKERIGATQSKAESLEEQLHTAHQHLTTKQQENQQLQQQLSQTQQSLAQLRTSLDEKQQHFVQQQQQLLDVRQQMNVEFQHLAQQILEEKSQSFAQTNQTALDLLLQPFKQQIEGFQKRVNEVHTEAVKGQANLTAEIKRVLDIGLSMSQEAQNLTTALKGNNKVVGNWGEIQLETALQNAGLLAGEHYTAQASYRDEQGKRFAPDFVLQLPDTKQLILDSKVSLLAYEQAVSSEEKFAIVQALNEHCRSLRNHIDGLSKKNYQQLIGVKSPDFVLMFIPIEAAYIEAMKHDPQLFNYGYERNVILVSYTTLMPILRTVANLWRIERGNAEAREISEKAGDIYNQVCLIAERLSKLGNTLSTASNQYNQAVTALAGKQGLVGKVERFQQLSNRAHQGLPSVEQLSTEYDTSKLMLQPLPIDSIPTQQGE